MKISVQNLLLSTWLSGALLDALLAEPSEFRLPCLKVLVALRLPQDPLRRRSAPSRHHLALGNEPRIARMSSD